MFSIYLTRLIYLFFLGVFPSAAPSRPVAMAAPGVTNPAEIAELITPVDLQLRALRNHDFEAAYAVNARPFQSATSLEVFKSFVEQYPILFSHKEIVVQSSVNHENDAEITVVLDPTKDAVPVKYLLVKEDNQWKIWNMKVGLAYSPKVTALLQNPVTIRTPVEKQLEALKFSDEVRAYHAFTSKEFQQTTSLIDFKNFLVKYPLFTEYETVEFGDPRIYDATGKVRVDFSGPPGTMQVEYTLGIEEEQWKIYGIQVLKHTPAPAKAPVQEHIEKKEAPQPQMMERVESKENQESSEQLGSQPPSESQEVDFTKMEVGSGSSSQGVVMSPTTVLQTPQGNIFIKLNVHNGQVGMKVNVRLQYLEKGVFLPPVSTTLQQEGDTTLSFEFAPPASGWPKGRYQLDATTSTGANKAFQFVVE